MPNATSEEGIVFEHGIRPPDAALADFDTDSFRLTRQHTEWLTDCIVRRNAAKAGLCGAWYNQRLSSQRIRTVESFLRGRIRGDRLLFDPVILGESAPRDHALNENAMDRSVRVRADFIVCGTAARRRPLLEPTFNKWRTMNREVTDFEIHVLAADATVVEVGFPGIPVEQGTITVKLFVAVEERGTGDTARYEFVGEGPAGHFKPPSASATDWHQRFTRGTKHRFATGRPMDAEDFSGHACMKHRERRKRPRRTFPIRHVRGTDPAPDFSDARRREGLRPNDTYEGEPDWVKE